MICDVCEMPILDGQDFQRLPAVSTARKGPKSGQLMVFDKDPYPNGQPREEELAHWPHCVTRYFSTEWDQGIEEAIREDIREELRDEVLEQVREETEEKRINVMRLIGEHNHNFCVECWDELEDNVEEEEAEEHIRFQEALSRDKY